MARKTAEQIASKYSRGVAGAGQDYLDGVQNPSRPWSQATQQGAARWKSGIQQAIANKSFEKGVSKAGDQRWQQAAVEKGAARYTQAATYAAQRYSEVAGRIMQAGSAAQSAVSNMPNETIEQRIARSAAAQMAIHNHWKGSRG